MRGSGETIHRLEFELEALEYERRWYPEDEEWQRKIGALIEAYQKRLGQAKDE